MTLPCHTTRRAGLALLAALALLPPAAAGDPQDQPLAGRARGGLKSAVAFFRDRVAADGSDGGGYLWLYSADLSRREGEGKASKSTAWVQPPGTPSVGLAFLRAYAATGDKYYLDAARGVGTALVRGQLRSGGWDYRIEFDPKDRGQYAYRQPPANPKGRNVTTLDDNTTQEALRLLMKLDAALGCRDEAIHGAALYGLDSLVKAQYPNGAWPQRFDTLPDPGKFPVRKAGYPDSWPREYPGTDYRGFYTLNDNTQADMIDVMFLAADTYDSDEYRKAALRGADFFLLAQMPDPQPIWAQQYNVDMHPAWARKFEPASVTGGESQGVLLTLLDVYRRTGDRKYLEPIPRALEYLRKIQLPDGRLARFYELKTGKPLYFTRHYRMTYKDDDLPTHYGFQVSSRVDRIAAEYDRVQKLPADQLRPRPGTPRVSKGMERGVEQVLAALDEEGRWTEKGSLKHDDTPGGRIISSRTFIRNVNVLSEYLQAVNAAGARK